MPDISVYASIRGDEECHDVESCILRLSLTLDVRFRPVAGAAVIDIVVTLLTVKLPVPMSGMAQAVREVD